jgi:hypothetical protein
VLVVEGFGDVEAVPRLVRDVAALHDLHDFIPAPNPKKVKHVAILRREFERWVELAWLEPDADCALFLVDCEDDCPAEVAKDLERRLSIMAARPQARPIGIVLAHPEFESLFLTSLPRIAARYPNLGWRAEAVAAWADGDVAAHRGVKEQLTGLMKAGRIYKQTEHQVRFVGCVDWDAARSRCRWFRHFERTILWLAGCDGPDAMVYPVEFP